MSEAGPVVEVERVAHGGICVAHHEGRVVFVRHALPGERVRLQVTEERRRYLRADAVEVLVPAPERVAPPCRYARPGGCGGCDWQHASLPAQRELKARVVAEQLERLAGLRRDVVVEPVPGDADGLGWRTRMRFAVRPDGVVGLRRHRSHQVQPIERCLIAHPLVEAAGVESGRFAGAREVLVAASPSTGERVVLAAPGPPAPTLHESAAGSRWQVHADGFWQVHPGAAQLFAATVAELADPRPGERVADLYCGVGLYAGLLAPRVAPGGAVLAVESDAAAVADATANLAGWPHAHVRAARIDAHTVRALGELAVAVLDPPRAGAGEAVCAALAAAGPRVVVYVACDPAALARDVAAFAAAGYRLDVLRAFDAFPMTAHVECIARLVPA